MKKLNITLFTAFAAAAALAPTAQAAITGSYQYVFVTSTQFTKTSPNIADYNAFV